MRVSEVEEVYATETRHPSHSIGRRADDEMRELLPTMLTTWFDVKRHDYCAPRYWVERRRKGWWNLRMDWMQAQEYAPTLHYHSCQHQILSAQSSDYAQHRAYLPVLPSCLASDWGAAVQSLDSSIESRHRAQVRVASLCGVSPWLNVHHALLKRYSTLVGSKMLPLPYP